jgi:hypothetical protein
VTRRSTARPFRLSVPLVVAAAALGLAGCQITSPVQTDVTYVAGDGVPVPLEDVHISNLVVISKEKGGPGTLSGAVLNRSRESRTITFAVEGGEPVSVEASPGEDREVASQEGALAVLPSVPEPPGAMVRLQISTGQGGGTVALVPVLPPELYYEGLAPKSGEGAEPAEDEKEDSGTPAATPEPEPTSH